MRKDSTSLVTADRIEKMLMEKSVFTDLISPDYNGYCLSNIPATILSAFNVSGFSKPSLADKSVRECLKDVKKLVLLLIDALSYSQLLNHVKRNRNSVFHRLIDEGVFLPITSTFPSTTTTALTSLSTGLTPQEHGIVGYTMYLKEFGMVANMISFSPAVDRRKEVLTELGLDLKAFLGSETIYQILGEHGVKSYLFTRSYLRNTGLSRMLGAGAEVIGYVNSPDFFVSLRKLLQKKQNTEEFIFAYWDAYDTVCHFHGPDSEEAEAELRGFEYVFETEFMDKLDKETAKDTVLMIISDHGQLWTPIEGAIMVTKHPKLMRSLRIPPTGDSRAAFLFAETGRMDYVKSYVERVFKGEADVKASSWMLKNGVLGTGRSRRDLKERIGDLVLLPYEGFSFIYPYKRYDQQDFHLQGTHGGLSKQEVLVPLVCATLGG